jgi:hypothetical protein
VSRKSEIEAAMAAAREIKDSRSKAQKKLDAEKIEVVKVLRKDYREDLTDDDIELSWTGSEGVWIAHVRLNPDDSQLSGVRVFLD